MSNFADVVVAGAGHNSLIMAANLARAGFDVLVCQANAGVGLLARHVQGFEAGDELVRVAESPLDLERRNRHNHRGPCRGGDLVPEQAGRKRPVPGWSGHRLRIPLLCQTGATTHPGESVSGRPGRNAARVLLPDLGVDPGELMPQ